MVTLAFNNKLERLILTLVVSPLGFKVFMRQKVEQSTGARHAELN